GLWGRSECEHCVSPNPKVSALASRDRSSAKRRKPRPPGGRKHTPHLAVTEAATPAVPNALEVSPAEAPAQRRPPERAPNWRRQFGYERRGLASNLAMSGGALAACTHPMGPPHSLQVSTSARKT